MNFLRRSLFTLALAAFSLSAPIFASDLSITASSVKPGANAVVRTWTAGEAILAGQLVYFNSSDFKVYLADGNHATAAVRDVYAIALTSSALGAPCTVDLDDDDLTIGATVTNGVVYGLSATAGGIAPWADQTTGWYPAAVAVGKSSTKVSFRAKGLRSVTAL